MKLRNLAIATCLAAVAATAFAQAKEQFFPALPYRTGPFAPNGVPWANGYLDYLKLVNARGGINGVKIIFEECETAYDTARGVECYERLKGKTRRRDLVPAAVHRHHLRADREGARRQDPADHRRLRPQRKPGRRCLQVELPAGRHLLAGSRRAGPVSGQEGRRPGQAQGQEDHAGLSRQPVRQRADPAAAGARQDAWLRPAAAARGLARHRAEGHLAADSPAQVRTTCCCGAGG